jgi:hypothetical protein
MGAVASKADVAAGPPYFCADPSGGTVGHDAAEVAPGNARRDGVSEMPGHVFHVARIDRRAADLDDGAVAVAFRHGRIDVLEYVRAAERLELQGFHLDHSFVSYAATCSG